MNNKIKVTPKVYTRHIFLCLCKSGSQVFIVIVRFFLCVLKYKQYYTVKKGVLHKIKNNELMIHVINLKYKLFI